MSLSTLRTPLRRALAQNTPARLASRTQQALRNPACRRWNSSAPPPSGAAKNNNMMFAGIGAATLAGLTFYIYSGDDSSERSSNPATKSGKQPIASGFIPTKEDYQKVYNSVAQMLARPTKFDDGSFGPLIVRLAWHSSGTWDKEKGDGGSNYSTMRFKSEASHYANNGLEIAREMMEEVHAMYPWISYGDLWTLAGVCAVQEMEGPDVPWRPGRIDGVEAQSPPDNRLPDATQGSDHLRQIFYRMGFNDREIVALSGAHALGRCHFDRSGFDGPWTFRPITVTNDYFKLLFDEKWVVRPDWKGEKQFQDKKTRSLMMLPTDMVLIEDPEFKKWSRAYADNESLFFKDFAAVMTKLFELGIPSSQWKLQDRWTMDRFHKARA